MSDAVTRLNAALKGRYAIEHDFGIALAVGSALAGRLGESAGAVVRDVVVQNFFEVLRERVGN